MAFSDHEKIANADKLALQIAGTANSSPGEQWWYNEALAWTPVVPPSKIWTDFGRIPGANTPTEADDNVVANPDILEKRKIRLTLRLESNNRAYLARSTYGDNAAPILSNGVQPALIQYSGGASNGYIARLFHGDPDVGGVEISTTQHGGTGGAPAWSFNYSAGILSISTDQSGTFKTYYDANGLWLIWYRYIGPTASGGMCSNEVKVTNSDIVPNFLDNKIVSGNGISTEVLASGGDEQLLISTTPEVLNSLRITEPIYLEVDYVNGASPPAGTVITNQAEYDALGSPLKYPQDVFDILPTFIDYPVIVDCVAGNHYAKAGTLVFPCFLYRPPYRASAKTIRADQTVPSEFRLPKIYFRGTTAITEAAVPGVTSYRDPTESSSTRDAIFTRDSGTWTPGELQGKFATITSGASSGQRYPIVDNTDTTIHFAGNVPTVGTCIIDIYECSTIFVPKLGPTEANVSLGIMGWWSTTEDAQHGKFKWIQFGTTTDKFNFSLTSKATDFLECSIHHNTAYMLEPLLGTRGYISFDKCQVNLNAQGLQARASRMDIFSSVISGNPSSGYIIQLREHSVAYCHYAYIKALSTYSGACLILLTDSLPTLQGRFEVLGNGLCVGVYFLGQGMPVTIEDNGYASVGGCDIACKFGKTLANLGQFAMSRTVNNIGWQLVDGAIVRCKNPTTILTTISDVDLGGSIVSYSQLAAIGDEVASNGVSIARS